MEWLAANWVWLLLVLGFIAMHLGHGHGGHGRRGSGSDGHDGHRGGCH
jgi:hypothetical protein